MFTHLGYPMRNLLGFRIKATCHVLFFLRIADFKYAAEKNLWHRFHSSEWDAELNNFLTRNLYQNLDI